MDHAAVSSTLAVALVLALVAASAAGVGFLLGRRQAGPPARAAQAAPTAAGPDFWRDLADRKGLAETGRVVATLSDAQLDVLWQATQGRSPRARRSSTDLDRLFFLADQERESRAQRRLQQQATREARHILKAILAAATVVPEGDAGAPRADRAPAP